MSSSSSGATRRVGRSRLPGVVAAQRREGGADQLGATGFPDRLGDGPLPSPTVPPGAGLSIAAWARWTKPMAATHRVRVAMA